MGDVMPQKKQLEAAAKKLLNAYIKTIDAYNLSEFLKTNVDPFRFSFSAAVHGLEEATRGEIEHKLAMKLENMVGDFHEEYLGNLTHIPSGSSWERIPVGRIPGIDIINTKINNYLQIKSKHNSMNSSSSKKLAEELNHLSIKLKKDGVSNATVGCGFVIASPTRSCIGESEILRLGSQVFKGSKLYAHLTGDPKCSMESVVKLFHEVVERESKGLKIPEKIKKTSEKIAKDLQAAAKNKSITVYELIFKNALE